MVIQQGTTQGTQGQQLNSFLERPEALQADPKSRLFDLMGATDQNFATKLKESWSEFLSISGYILIISGKEASFLGS